MNSIEAKLNELIASLTPEQYRKVMTAVKTQSPTQVDMKYKLKRLRITESYHSSAPKPHQCDDFDSYVMHSDAIREQVMH
jgi:hypothetical protein